MASIQYKNVQNLESHPHYQHQKVPPLKFGIDQILASPPPEPPPVPCSECMVSIFRCCTNGLINHPYNMRSGPTKIDGPHHLGGLHNQSPPVDFSPLLVTTNDPTIRQNNRVVNRRKRSWSRAVFSNLQRKGLERRFQLQKYITKPDRRQLAATLGLTDAQVKVWFQNRRMKWRHTQQSHSEPIPITTNNNNNDNREENINQNSDEEENSDT